VKRCPHCHRIEPDDALAFCRADGTPLVRESQESAGTLKLDAARAPGETDTRLLSQTGAAHGGETHDAPAAATTGLGERPTAARTQELSKPKSRRGAVVAFGALLLVAAIAASVYFYTRSRGASTSAINSVAVLPFVNAGNDQNAEYLSDGVAESLMNSLSQLPDLKVASRNSAFRYKGKEQDAQRVGKELGVRAVLTGSVKEIGEQIVISVSLDDAADGHHIWGEQYPRKLADILSVQRDIAQEVTNNLRLKLSNAAERQLKKNYTDNAEAYQLYLKGNFFASQYTKDGLAKGIDYYNRAIAADRNYALAYNGLAYYYIVESDWYSSPNDAMPRAREAARRALAIDETLADAHTSLGVVACWYDWDWVTAEREFRRSIDLDPHDSRTRQYYALFLAVMGRGDEAVEQARKGQQIDPLSPEVNTFLGCVLVFARRYDEAIEQQRKTVEMDSSNWFAHDWFGRAYEGKKQFEQAITEFQKARQEQSMPEVLGILGHAYAASGNRAEAQKIIEELHAQSSQSYIPPYDYAVIYAGLGDQDRAFEWLDRASKDRSAYLTWIKADPQMDSLRADARFQDLLQRMNFPQ
jgi:TolB-like protein/Flp pilus assembly protein TadD